MRAAWKLAALALVLFAVPVDAQNAETKKFVLFGGGAFDSTEKASPWIPIHGANRVVIRSWSTKAAWHISTDADSTFSDSLSAFSVLFSDSVSFIARDSAGTIVTHNPNAYTLAANRAAVFPMCADSFVISHAGSRVDTTFKMVAFASGPVNRILRAPANGSGVFTIVYPTAPASIGAYGDGSFTPRFMRIRATAVRRHVGAGLMTAGTRVNGLKGFRMEAEVIYNRK